VANFAAAAIAGVNPMAIGGYAVKLAIGGFVVPFFFLFNPGLTLEGGLANIAIATVFGTACTAFASFALHGLLGARDIPGVLRILLWACCVATIVPRPDVQSAAVVAGLLALAFVHLRRRPREVDIPA